MSDSRKPSRELIEKYQLTVPEDVVESILAKNPKVPVLLSRASFRPETIRTSPEIKRQQERRNLFRNMLGVIALTVPIVVWVKIAFFSPPAQIPTYVSSGGGGGRLLSNASSIPVNQSLTFNDPTYGPFVLIHLDNDQFVAYSAICTHAGCEVQFNPYAKEITCPCHGAVYNPYNSAQVVAGPAPFPLQKIPIQYDATTGNIYLG